MPIEMTGRVADRHSAESGNLQFDYTSVPSSVAKFLKGQADRIRRQCVTSIIQIGKALLESKRHLSHGEFLEWVEAAVGIPARTAQAYMRVATWASAKSATLAHLQPSALYLLSASSTPQEFVKNILSRIEAGEHIAVSAMRKELDALNRNQQQERVKVEKVTSRVPSKDLKHLADAPETKRGASAINELVAILVQGLSEEDFVRVQAIATSDAVLTDPQLARNLERAFLSYEESIRTDYHFDCAHLLA